MTGVQTCALPIFAGGAWAAEDCGALLQQAGSVPQLTVVGVQWMDYSRKLDPLLAEGVLRTLALDLAVRWGARVVYCDEHRAKSLPADWYPRLQATKKNLDSRTRKHDIEVSLVRSKGASAEVLFELPADQSSFAALERALSGVTGEQSSRLARAIGLLHEPRKGEAGGGVASGPAWDILLKAHTFWTPAAAEVIEQQLVGRPLSVELREAGVWANITLMALYPHPYYHGRSRWMARPLADYAVLRALVADGGSSDGLRGWMAWACGYPVEAGGMWCVACLTGQCSCNYG